jgi:hypothetical protein
MTCFFVPVGECLCSDTQLLSRDALVYYTLAWVEH